MTLRSAISALKEKQSIISRTDDDHWLYEPINTVLEELELLRTAYELSIDALRCVGGGYEDVIREDLIDHFIEQAREGKKPNKNNYSKGLYNTKELTNETSRCNQRSNKKH